MGTAKTKAQNKYISKTYDKISLLVPKGKKDIISNYAKTHNYSVNAFINKTIDKFMEENKTL